MLCSSIFLVYLQEELLNLKNRYIVKNYIEEFETQLALFFKPKWRLVNMFDSPARQSIEIRRQKWNYIFDNFNDSRVMQNLNVEMNKAGINQTIFCNDIADIYFLISDNAYIFDKDPTKNNKRKIFVDFRDPMQEKCVQIFMNAVSDFMLDFNKDEPTVSVHLLGTCTSTRIIQVSSTNYLDLLTWK